MSLSDLLLATSLVPTCTVTDSTNLLVLVTLRMSMVFCIVKPPIDFTNVLPDGSTLLFSTFFKFESPKIICFVFRGSLSRGNLGEEVESVTLCLRGSAGLERPEVSSFTCSFAGGGGGE